MNSALCLHSRRLISPLAAASNFDLLAGLQLLHHAVDFLLLVAESGRRCCPTEPGPYRDGRCLHALCWRGSCLLLLGEGNWLNRAAGTLLRDRCGGELRGGAADWSVLCRGGWLSRIGRCPGDRLSAWQ